MKITPKTKMDKMPRARRIFILHKENPELIDQQILEICKMLKFGFGRWNELMTYPSHSSFCKNILTMQQKQRTHYTGRILLLEKTCSIVYIIKYLVYDKNIIN